MFQKNFLCLAAVSRKNVFSCCYDRKFRIRESQYSVKPGYIPIAIKITDLDS